LHLSLCYYGVGKRKKRGGKESSLSHPSREPGGKEEKKGGLMGGGEKTPHGALFRKRGRKGHLQFMFSKGGKKKRKKDD